MVPDNRLDWVDRLINSGILALILKLLREALFPSGSEEKLMFGFVRIIIDFCERYLEGVTGLLDLGSLSLGF